MQRAFGRSQGRIFSKKCVVGNHRADAGKEGEATMAKLVRMTAACGEGSGVMGIMDAWQLPDTIMREPRDKHLDPVIDKLCQWVTINGASAAIYLMQDPQSAAELGLVTSALAACQLAAKPFYIFEDGVDNMSIGLLVHASEPHGPAKAALEQLTKRRFSVTGGSPISSRDRLNCVTVNEATGKKSMHAFMANERSVATCRSILEALVPKGAQSTIVLDHFGEVGSWAAASIQQDIKSLTNVRRPRVLEALQERLDNTFAEFVKVPLPKEPKLMDMPEPPECISNAKPQLSEESKDANSEESSGPSPKNSKDAFRRIHGHDLAMSFTDIMGRFINDECFADTVGTSHVFTANTAHDEWVYHAKDGFVQPSAESGRVVIRDRCEFLAIATRSLEEELDVDMENGEKDKEDIEEDAEGPPEKKLKTN